jgi:hypothetical protein
MFGESFGTPGEAGCGNIFDGYVDSVSEQCWGCKFSGGKPTAAGVIVVVVVGGGGRCGCCTCCCFADGSQ